MIRLVLGGLLMTTPQVKFIEPIPSCHMREVIDPKTQRKVWLLRVEKKLGEQQLEHKYIVVKHPEKFKSVEEACTKYRTRKK